jgi:hypothetical protein
LSPELRNNLRFTRPTLLIGEHKELLHTGIVLGHQQQPDNAKVNVTSKGDICKRSLSARNRRSRVILPVALAILVVRRMKAIIECNVIVGGLQNHQ